MAQSKAKMWLFIVSTVFISLVLLLMPIPNWVEWVWPHWVVLIVIFLCLYLPNSVSVGLAWVIGLLLDVVYNVTFGENAVMMVLIAYFIGKFREKIVLFGFWHSLFVVFALVILYQVLPVTMQMYTGQYLTLWLCLSRAVVSAVVWPILLRILLFYQGNPAIENNY